MKFNKILLGVILSAIGGGVVAAPATTVDGTSTPNNVYASHVAQNMQMSEGQTLELDAGGVIKRVSVGDPAVVDVAMVHGQRLLLVGMKIGSTKVYLWGAKGILRSLSISVSVDVSGAQAKIQQLLPNEHGLQLSAAEGTYILSGVVSSELAARQAEVLVKQYGHKVINMLKVLEVQQVLLEVRVAEISKSIDDKLGSGLTSNNYLPGPNGVGIPPLGALGVGANDALNAAGNVAGVANLNFFSGSAGFIALHGGNTLAMLDGEVNDGRAKILAEPNITAISGQQASFLAGGKLFIPVVQPGLAGQLATVILQEEDFGVGLTFIPTVLENGSINLRVTPEVSELSATGSSFSAGGTITVIPTINTRRASTTVQLNDGQTFSIGGLIQNNVTEAIKAFPGLGELPIIGALFRSSEFQSNRTELVFIVTPHLVRPSDKPLPLPTDNFITPTRSEFQLEGKMEGRVPDKTAGTGGPAPMQSMNPETESSGVNSTGGAPSSATTGATVK